jgi:hypothetical protein
MDAEENQHQVSLGATPRLEIAARFPHFHRLDRAEEKWKANRRLPTFPQHGLLSLPERRPRRRLASLAPSRLIVE